ncbi:MAG: hypothetical protein K2G09_06295 [Paramuribaculum sp.]|nr:hypothetical protein [Paramuribaculum sp.]
MDTRVKVTFDKDFADRQPDYRTLLIEADVTNSNTGEALKAELDALASDIGRKYKVEDINKIPAVAATRAAYKACGKDPNRYRPSQEQMIRRIVRGLGLYYVNSLVDAGNILSLRSGCAVGCFDGDKIDGDVITLGIGKEREPYEGIGRGELNIAGLPVFRDRKGGFGTPTSDNVRTCIELPTKRILVTVHLFDREIDADKVLQLFTDLFTRFCGATDIHSTVFNVQV